MKKILKFLSANKSTILAIVSLAAGLLVLITVLAENGINFKSILGALIAGGFVSLVIFMGIGSFFFPLEGK